MGKLKTYIEVPKFAQFGNALRKFCFEHNFELDMFVEKGIFRETIYFTITCPDNLLESVQNSIKETINEYNK